MDRQFDGAPVQVRVTMGKEPRHFMAIFKGRLVIFEVRTLTQNDTMSGITQTNKATGGPHLVGRDGDQALGETQLNLDVLMHPSCLRARPNHCPMSLQGPLLT